MYMYLSIISPTLRTQHNLHAHSFTPATASRLRQSFSVAPKLPGTAPSHRHSSSASLARCTSWGRGEALAQAVSCGATEKLWRVRTFGGPKPLLILIYIYIYIYDIDNRVKKQNIKSMYIILKELTC